MKNSYRKLIKNIDFANKIGADFPSKLKLFYSTIQVTVGRKLGLIIHLDLKVKIQKFNRSAEIIVTDASDLNILKDIFYKDEYNYPVISPESIFDIGSNVGISAIFFHLKFPTAQIFAFEPAPTTFSKLERNTSSVPQIHRYNIAISGKDGVETLYVHAGSSASSSMTRRDGDLEPIQVKSVALDSVMFNLGLKSVDLIKFDIEGSEYDVFANFKSIDQVRSLIGEVHLDLMNHNLKDFLSLFENFSHVAKETSKNRRYDVYLTREF